MPVYRHIGEGGLTIQGIIVGENIAAGSHLHHDGVAQVAKNVVLHQAVGHMLDQIHAIPFPARTIAPRFMEIAVSHLALIGGAGVNVTVQDFIAFHFSHPHIGHIVEKDQLARARIQPGEIHALDASVTHHGHASDMGIAGGVVTVVQRLLQRELVAADAHDLNHLSHRVQRPILIADAAVILHLDLRIIAHIEKGGIRDGDGLAALGKAARHGREGAVIVSQHFEPGHIVGVGAQIELHFGAIRALAADNDVRLQDQRAVGGGATLDIVGSCGQEHRAAARGVRVIDGILDGRPIIQAVVGDGIVGRVGHHFDDGDFGDASLHAG